MKGIITIVGIIIGILIIRFSKNTEKKNLIKWLGVLVILVCIAVAIPDFVSGFIEGMIDGTQSIGK